jgi:4-amino-4-deoxy-L-arabinose transferase-like glycosyltransferase
VSSPPAPTVDRPATYEKSHALSPSPWSGASVESNAAPRRPAAPSFRLSLLLAALIVVASFVARLRLIDGSMPYPAHLDERQLADPAAAILRTGDWNPHDFEYPTLPVYLVAASFAAGYLDASATRAVKRVSDIGSVSFPYYSHRRIVRPARLLFALLGVISLGLSGVIARRLMGDPRLLWIAPLVLASATTFLQLSWRYLNVDIVGCTFVAAVLAFLMDYWEADDLFHRCVIPGAFCGLALASKYNLFTALAPAVSAILLRSARGRSARIALLLAVAAATFVAAVPYAILDVPAFLDGAGGAVHHYAFGHPGFSAEPGWPQLAYYGRVLIGDFGAISLPLVALGVAATVRQDWRRAAVLVSFPVAQLFYMSLQRAHFPRNIVSVYPVYAAFEAVGWVAVYATACSAFSGLTVFATRKPAKQAAVAALIALAVALGVPWRRAASEYLRQPDSRKLATSWVRDRVPKGSTVVVAHELAMDTGSLRPDYRIVEEPLRSVHPATMEGAADAYWVIPRMGFKSRRWPAGEAELNQAFDDELEPLARFGQFPVLIDYPERAPWGDPLLTIARLKPAR